MRVAFASGDKDLEFEIGPSDTEKSLVKMVRRAVSHLRIVILRIIVTLCVIC